MLLFLLAYLGGVLTIVSPCILPVIPFVLARADRPFLRNGLPMLVGMAPTPRRQLDKTETERAAWVNGNGIEAYKALGDDGAAKVTADFKSERQRAQFVNENGLAVYKALPD